MYYENLNGVVIVLHRKKSIYNLASLLMLCLVFIMATSKVLTAEEASRQNHTPDKVMFGIAGTGGLFSAIHLRGSDDGGEPEWKPGWGVGGGLVFDYMFSKSTGLHSGLYYYYSRLILEMSTETEPIDLETTVQMIQMPLYFFYALNGNIVTIDLLGGFHFSYITHVRMSADGNENRAIQFMGYQQPGIGTGLRFRFHITNFIDMYLATMAEFYANDLIAANTDWTDYMYDARGEIGILFKTF